MMLLAYLTYSIRIIYYSYILYILEIDNDIITESESESESYSWNWLHQIAFNPSFKLLSRNVLVG